MAVPGPTTSTTTAGSRAELVAALATSVRMRVMTQAQADQYLAQYDRSGGTAASTTSAATMGLPGDQSAGFGGGLQKSDVFQLRPLEEGTPQWIQQNFGGVGPAYQKGIQDLAQNKYWDWLLTRHRLPADVGGTGATDWQAFLNRELAGGGLAGGAGRQAGAGDIDWLANLAGQANGPDALSDPLNNWLWSSLQVNPDTGRANMGNINNILQGVVGSAIPQWLQGATFDIMGNKMAQQQALDPRQTGSALLKFARTLGLPF